MLRALGATDHDDAGRRVGQAHGGVGRVDVLPARARGAIGVDPQFAFVDLDVDIVIDDRIDPDARKAGVATSVRIIGADTDQAVDAALHAEPAIREAAGDGDRGALDAGLLARLPVQDLRLEPVALAPAQVHALQHLRPVRGLGTAGARADRDDGVLGVVLAAEEEEGPLALELGAQGIGLAGDLGRGLLVWGVRK